MLDFTFKSSMIKIGSSVSPSLSLSFSLFLSTCLFNPFRKLKKVVLFLLYLEMKALAQSYIINGQNLSPGFSVFPTCPMWGVLPALQLWLYMAITWGEFKSDPLGMCPGKIVLKLLLTPQHSRDQESLLSRDPLQDSLQA